MTEKLKRAAAKYGRPFKCAANGLPREVIVRYPKGVKLPPLRLSRGKVDLFISEK